MRNPSGPTIQSADGKPADGQHNGDHCPLHTRPPLSHPLHWPFRTWSNILWHHPVELLAVATVILLVGGSGLLYWAEHGARVPPDMIAIRSWWDALWLCATSATTDSYGDVAPHTPMGRLLSIMVAFLGIILVGSFTASITSYIIREPSGSSAMFDELRQRLDRIEKLLEEKSSQ